MYRVLIAVFFCALVCVTACGKSEKNPYELERSMRESYRALKAMESETNK